MNTYIAPRLLIPLLALVLMIGGALSAPATARAQLDELSWSETESQENVLVQTCDGFDLTTSYTVNRDYHRFIDVSDNLNVEWMGVDFAGAIGNSVTGKSYAYDGKLMRWSDYDNNETVITNLTLRFEVGAPGQFSVAIDRIELDLETDPSAVIKAFVPNALQMELCYLMGAPAAGEPFDPIANYAPGTWINVQAADSASEPQLVPSFDDRMGKDQSAIDDTESSALNPPPNYQSGDSTVVCDPRKGYPQDCAVLP